MLSEEIKNSKENDNMVDNIVIKSIYILGFFILSTSVIAQFVLI